MTVSVPARPYEFALDPARAAFVIIDMQRDFLEPGGFGDALGNDVLHLRAAISPIGAVLAAARGTGMLVIHTREGHRADLSDLHASKHQRGRFGTRIGDPGPMGRILVQGEAGHGIIAELSPLAGEPIIDKPGKGAFYATDLETILRARGITQLILAGVTTEVCVHTTLREANDRGFDCLVLEDGTASYFPEFHAAALEMACAQGGIFGWVARSSAVISALTQT
ncbi:MAG: isochorismatase [Rhodospirillales bacterium 20-64-7]|nr:MAG: isochorismatase [Rhodospirillales bacterium 20-64-7]